MSGDSSKCFSLFAAKEILRSDFFAAVISKKLLPVLAATFYMNLSHPFFHPIAVPVELLPLFTM